MKKYQWYKLPELNLQLHSDFFPEGGEPESNPILTDGEDVDTSTSSTEASESHGEGDSTQGNTNVPTETQTAPNNDYQQIQSQLDAILNTMNKSSQVETPPEAPPEPVGLTEEEIEAKNNDFYLKFTDKPLEALEELIEERANQKMKPMTDYFEGIQKMNYWNSQIDNFEKQHPDFKEYLEDVSKIIEKDETIRGSKNPLELAYKVAKADKMDSNNVPLSEQIKDNKTLKELLSNNEIKNLIIKELKLNTGNIPTVVGTDGKTSFNVSDKPRTIEDATKAWLNS